MAAIFAGDEEKAKRYNSNKGTVMKELQKEANDAIITIEEMLNHATEIAWETSLIKKSAYEKVSNNYSPVKAAANCVSRVQARIEVAANELVLLLMCVLSLENIAYTEPRLPPAKRVILFYDIKRCIHEAMEAHGTATYQKDVVTREMKNVMIEVEREEAEARYEAFSKKSAEEAFEKIFDVRIETNEAASLLYQVLKHARNKGDIAKDIVDKLQKADRKIKRCIDTVTALINEIRQLHNDAFETPDISAEQRVKKYNQMHGCWMRAKTFGKEACDSVDEALIEERLMMSGFPERTALRYELKAIKCFLAHRTAKANMQTILTAAQSIKNDATPRRRVTNPTLPAVQQTLKEMIEMWHENCAETEKFIREYCRKQLAQE